VKVRGIFAAYQTFPQGLMMHESFPAKNLQELFAAKGTLAIQKAVPYALFLNKKYAQKDSKIRQIPYSGGIGAFLKDKTMVQQCFVTSEPIVARRQGAKVRTLMIAESGYNPYTTVVIAKDELLDDRKEVAARMARAIRRGWQSYVSNPTDTNVQMQKINRSMSEADFKDSAEAQTKLVRPDGFPLERIGEMTVARWEELLAALKDVGSMSAESKVLAADLFRNF
jgi:NitT/TauT family transport system substrate-binding protein